MQLDFLQVGDAETKQLQKTDMNEPEEIFLESEDKAPGAFKTISEVASALSVPQHVLRFWESRFSQIRPLKLRGGRRYYRPEDIEILTRIQHLLYKQGYTIKGAKKAFGKDAAAVEEVPVKAKSSLNDRQLSQLSVIRHELMAMREVLKDKLKA